MSTFIIHLLIPVLVVLALGLFRQRDAWIWSWPAVAGDIDYLGWMAHVKWGVPNVHRALFHNVYLLILLAWLAWRAYGRWNRQTGGATLKGFALAKPGWLLAPFYYASHLLLDVFAGGIVALWPLSNRDFFWDFEISVDTTKPIPQPEVVSDPGSVPYVPPVSEIYTWMTGEQFAFFLLYALSIAFIYVYERNQRRRLSTTPVPEPLQPSPTFEEAPGGRGPR